MGAELMLMRSKQRSAACWMRSGCSRAGNGGRFTMTPCSPRSRRWAVSCTPSAVWPRCMRSPMCVSFAQCHGT